MDRRHQIDAHLDVLLDLEDSERDAYLGEISPRDLRDEVRRMLRGCEGDGVLKPFSAMRKEALSALYGDLPRAEDAVRPAPDPGPRSPWQRPAAAEARRKE